MLGRAEVTRGDGTRKASGVRYEMGNGGTAYLDRATRAGRQQPLEAAAAAQNGNPAEDGEV